MGSLGWLQDSAGRRSSSGVMYVSCDSDADMNPHQSRHSSWTFSVAQL